jgi:hypothetical protein
MIAKKSGKAIFPQTREIPGQYPRGDLCENGLNCHSEGAKRPKNLINTRSFASLRVTKDAFSEFSMGSERGVWVGVIPSYRQT